MPNSRFMCLALLGVLASMGCKTTVGLTDGPPAKPIAGVAGNRPPSVKIEGASGAGASVATGARLTLLAEAYDADGDQVTLIKDLEVKGAGQTLKRGTLIKSIRLTGDPQEIDCRHEGIRGLVLRAEFVRKR